MRFDRIPKELRDRPRWVCVKQGSKVPMQAKLNKAGSTSDPNTWSDFDTAADAVRSGRYDYLGFVFNGDGIIGVDIDKGYDDGLLNDLSIDCIPYQPQEQPVLPYTLLPDP